MKKIIDFLEENAIEYRRVNYGNPYYYNDGFTIPAVQISFDYELSDDPDELHRKERLFLQYISRRKTHCIAYQGKSGVCIPWYSVMGVSDYKRQQEHENRIKADVEKFWIEEHARREAEKLAAAM